MQWITNLLPSVLICLLPLTSLGKELFVAADGLTSGDGSRQRSWALGVALMQTKTVAAGDTVWLLPGTYRGGFVCELKGTEAAPITIRGAKGKDGARVTLDLTPRDAKDDGELSMRGEWLVVRDLEVMCSDPKRSTEISGSWPANIRRGNVAARGSNIKFINLVVHDLGTGFGMWGNEVSGFGGEVYGCLIYHNGWNGPDRGHGHGIYTQNAKGTKRIEDNLIFNQFGYGLHAYGSEKAFLRGYHIEGNVMFNNGALKAPGYRTSDLAVGGSCAMKDIVIRNNCTYGGGGMRIGYGGDVLNRALTMTGNVIAGGSRFTAVNEAVYRDNTLIAPGTLLSWDEPATRDSGKIEWDGNRYVRTKNEFGAFNIAKDGRTQGRSFAEWQAFLGGDAGSIYTEGAMTGQKVIVRANRYEPGRGHVVVYNWDKAPKVTVELGAVLKAGQRYRMVSAQDFYGEAVVSGVFDGKAVEVPMQARKAVRPVGMEGYEMPMTEPEFGVFVVLGE